MAGTIDLQGHAALVTGSTQGVGAAIAEALAAAGADLVLHGLEDHAAARRTLAACRAAGVRAELVLGDLVADFPSGLEQVAGEAQRRLPQLDLLVNNAGGFFDRPFLEMDLATFDKTMKLNVYAYYFLTQWFARHWVANRVGGRVLLVGSINGRLAEPDHTAYDTSKGAVEMMVRSLCVSLAPQGIRVNGLAPGLFYTPLTASALDRPEFRQWMERHTPNGSVPTPEVCGEAAVYLLSDAARHVHGQMLLVDGGMSVWQQPDPPSG